MAFNCLHTIKRIRTFWVFKQMEIVPFSKFERFSHVGWEQPPARAVVHAEARRSWARPVSIISRVNVRALGPSRLGVILIL